ncbi:MAG TPA: 1-acyl-sn-glycerol-3-phosphate acyltransferase, partial [Spirochaetota bacterium]
MIWKILLAVGRIILRRRYRIRITGLETIMKRGKQGILFMPNHPALIDPVIMVTHLSPIFHPRVLADRDRIDYPVLRSLMKYLRVIPMSDAAAYGDTVKAEVEQALLLCGESLANNENVLLYPSGHIYRSRLESLGGNSSVETILSRAPDARIVLVRTRGLWGSSLSWAAGNSPNLGNAFLKGAGGLLKSFIFFAPKRHVDIEFVEPDDFPRRDGRVVMNRYMELFYNENAPYNTYVPYSIWEKGGTRTIPEPDVMRYAGSTDDISAATKKIIF